MTVSTRGIVGVWEKDSSLALGMTGFFLETREKEWRFALRISTPSPQLSIIEIVIPRFYSIFCTPTVMTTKSNNFNGDSSLTLGKWIRRLAEE